MTFYSLAPGVSAVGAVEVIREFAEFLAERGWLDNFGAVSIREYPTKQEFIVESLHRDA